MPSRSCLITTEALKEFAIGLRANGCKFDGAIKYGYLTVRDEDGNTVLKALQKDSGPWITRFIESERIKWSKPCV